MYVGTLLVGTFPIQSAVAWNISLLCFGESIAEADGRSSYKEQGEGHLNITWRYQRK